MYYYNYGYACIEKTEGKIERLKCELEDARKTILQILPEELRKLLWTYDDCKSPAEAREWKDTIVEEILDYVYNIPHDSPMVTTGIYHPYVPEIIIKRAYCPLCGSGTQSWGEWTGEGFAFPEGLRRHLIGYGKMSICSVMEQVLIMAGEHWREAFAEQIRLEKEQADARLAEAAEALLAKPRNYIGPDGKSYVNYDHYSATMIGPNGKPYLNIAHYQSMQNLREKGVIRDPEVEKEKARQREERRIQQEEEAKLREERRIEQEEKAKQQEEEAKLRKMKWEEETKLRKEKREEKANQQREKVRLREEKREEEAKKRREKVERRIEKKMKQQEEKRNNENTN